MISTLYKLQPRPTHVQVQHGTDGITNALVGNTVRNTELERNSLGSPSPVPTWQQNSNHKFVRFCPKADSFLDLLHLMESCSKTSLLPWLKTF